jgi:uncharacterized protein (DUF488 family)
VTTSTPASESLVVWTIGHSSRSAEAFVARLRSAGIETVADVRRYPGSRAHPQFNAGPLARHLAAEGIGYVPFTDLGGRRQPRPDSPNTVWRNASFRAYADYMETAEYDAALERLIEMARRRRTCIMCSEALWWRCHRAMIADSLKARDATVLHVMEGDEVTEHPFTPPARIVGGRLTYGAAPG